MTVHELKILPEYLIEVVLGNKKAELRYCDRDYKVGDLLFLRGYNDGKYIGVYSVVKITCITHCAFALQPNYAMLSFKLLYSDVEKTEVIKK